MASHPLTHRTPGAVLAAWLITAACGDGRDARALFELLPPERTGITFANTITTSERWNVETDVYIYNGAGVAVGDIDNDGLADIYFAGNMVSGRLYRNTGGMRFEDITERAGVGTTRWATGVTMVDIDADGFLDIHVSVSGPEWSTPAERANLLFVNNRDGTFREAAAAYGIDDRGFTTHAAFLDHDGDGCLDLFLLNNSPRDFSRANLASRPSGVSGATPDSHNQLYRNDCRGRFTNVSERAGILRQPGYGLGVAIGDLNRDARPDIYVSNDAAPNDVLYVNDGGGRFSDRAGRWLKHASVAGMGVDVADFNDDGWPDILQVDMLPRSAERRRRMSGTLSYGGMLETRSRGYRDDYSLNTLQLSNGRTAGGDVLFSEIARMAGVAHTDWSWSALFADFDNDGRKDVFIGNGYPKAVNDLDYVAQRRAGASPAAAYQDLQRLPGYEEPNYLFRNRGDLTFDDVSAAWGIARPSYSYGAAYADLDNDGALDLVVNNIDAAAFIYRNVGGGKAPNHYLTVALEGDAPNRRGIGATVVLTAGGRKQHLYQSPWRGYMSTVDDRLHFGLGASARADSLEVTWPDGRYQLLTGVDADRQLVVRQSDARAPVTPPAATAAPIFRELSGAGAPAYLHRTPAPSDYSVQPLLPYMVSRQGPPLAVGDATGDGLDDLYVGGTAGEAGKLFVQGKDGSFSESAGQPWAADPRHDDWGALFVDVNGDRRLDLYVSSGGYHQAPSSPLLQDRLYINQGSGRFVRDSAALPPVLASTGAVRAGDFNGDGRPDLFVAGRLTPRSWPMPTRSFLLRNDGGRFTDVTAQVAPELAAATGMITDAAWIDFDGDGRQDLVTVGEFMPIAFHRNDGTRLRDVTTSMRLPPLRGWWYSLATGDFDGDGRMDLVAGNLGLNQFGTASRAGRIGVRAGDFSGSRRTDVILTERIDGKEYPIAGLASLGRELYTLGLRFPTHASFATATVQELLTPAQLQQAVHLEVDTFASVVLHGDGKGSFTMSPLPNLAQISPVRAIAVHDVDGDAMLDLIIGGNIYDVEPNTARADAGNGLWLRGDGKGSFVAVSPHESGFLVPRNVTGLAVVKTSTGAGLIVANAGDSLQTFRIVKP